MRTYSYAIRCGDERYEGFVQATTMQDCFIEAFCKEFGERDADKTSLQNLDSWMGGDLEQFLDMEAECEPEAIIVNDGQEFHIYARWER